MFWTHLLFLVCFLSDVRSSVSLPTKDEICANPLIDGGLALTELDGDSITKRYLFYKEYVLPYIRDENRQEIDWQNIGLISETFAVLPESEAPDYSQGIQFAFEYQSNGDNNTQIFVRFRNQDVYIFDKMHSGFKFNRLADIPDFTFEAIVLDIKDSLTQSESRTYFADMTSIPSKKEGEVKYEIFTYSGGVFEYFGINCDNCSQRLRMEFYPIVILFTNNAGKRTIIPIDFDGYYQTMYSETIFFRRGAACVTIANTMTMPREAEYCRSFVDTRTIIGCESNLGNTLPPNQKSPEVDLGEPDDIEPDF